MATVLTVTMLRLSCAVSQEAAVLLPAEPQAGREGELLAARQKVTQLETELDDLPAQGS